MKILIRRVQVLSQSEISVLFKKSMLRLVRDYIGPFFSLHITKTAKF